MAEVGLGQLATLTGRYRSKKLKDAVRDANPLYKALEEHGGIKRVSGGRTYVDESLMGQNSSVAWVGEGGTVSLADQKAATAPEFVWKYQLASIVYTLAEQYQNSGEGKYIDLVSAKQDAAEGSCMNEFHEGMVSAGTGSGGLQLNGVAQLVSTTPTTGTVGTIDRSSSDANWYRNQKFDTSGDWSDGSVDAGNALRFLDKLINLAMLNGIPQQQLMTAGSTHYEYISTALGAKQQVVNVSDVGKGGFDKLVYRSIPIYMGNGINYSGATAHTTTRTYALNVKPGGVNLVFHNRAEFDMLEPLQSENQAAISRLLFTMALMTIGAFAKRCVVGFD